MLDNQACRTITGADDMKRYEWDFMFMMANDIQGCLGPKFSWHLCYGWGKTPENPQPGKLTRPGIEPEIVGREETMLPLDHSGGRNIAKTKLSQNSFKFQFHKCIQIKFNHCSEFRWNPEGPVSQIHSPYLHVGAPGIFSNLLRSVQFLRSEWGSESNGKPLHLFNPW